MNIYCDLDGVLADFDTAYMNLTGKMIKDAEDDDVWQKVNQTSEFWQNLPLKNDAPKLIKYIKGISDMNIKLVLSSSMGTVACEVGKRNWCSKHLPFIESTNIVIVNGSENKRVYATKYSVLIDDYDKNVDSWILRGGISILHTSAADTISKLKRII